MKKTVLLVDDDELLRHGLRRALLSEPYRLLLAADARDAKSFLLRHTIDVVVADDRMPGVSGVDLLVWAAENCPEVIRIVLTGYATPESAEKASARAKVHRFLTKPCDSGVLADAIRESLAEREADAAAARG